MVGFYEVERKKSVVKTGQVIINSQQLRKTQDTSPLYLWIKWVGTGSSREQNLGEGLGSAHWSVSRQVNCAVRKGVCTFVMLGCWATLVCSVLGYHRYLCLTGVLP